MNALRIAAGAAALILPLTLAASGCGTGGSNPTRPIEVLYYVSGGQGLQFQLIQDPDPANCGSDGAGIQSRNADHRFGDRVFFTPHLFVLENDLQPMRMVIRNLDTLPINVDMFFASTLRTNGTVNPGACQTIGTDTTNSLVPKVSGPEIQVEVCAPVSGLSTPCLDSTADRALAFFGSIGDLHNTNITNCVVTPPLFDTCRTPATFFMEQPQDRVDAVMSINSGQNPPGQPEALLRAELFVNGQLTDTDSGSEPIVSEEF